MSDIEKFKCLLEYFVAHLDWLQNQNINFIGYEKYIKPLYDKNIFTKNSYNGYGYGQGWNDGKIQNLIKEWENYDGAKVCINVYAANIQSRATYLNWKNSWNNIRPIWDDNKVTTLYITEEEKTDAKSELEYTIDALGLYQDNITEELKSFYEKFMSYNQNNTEYDNLVNKLKILLEKNHNIILTGAPGTGKTYLAKKVAESMGCSENEIGFVQFHPSYDYTDFVEGLRPIEKDGNIGFERKDGVFKEFCKKAIMQSAHYVHTERNVHHLTNSNYSSHVYINKSNTFRDLFLQIQTDIKKGKIKSLKSPTSHGNFINVNYDNIKDRITFNNQKKTIEESHLELLFNYFKDKNIYNLSGYERQDYFEIISKLTPNTKTIDYTHYACILQELLNRAKNPIDNNNLDLFYEENTKNTESHDSPKNFVFIIDEINRGEISKIFGELFYSIDPCYRGKSDKTLPLSQYHNLIPEGDIFKDGFYVPDNVYIIGTMNDIDRSVESMDFAFRRRFAFIEIKAEDRLSMLDELNDESLKTKATNRLKNINKAISEIECLSPAYHIGASYFLKLNNYGGNFELLWEYHIEGLLREYMRGMRNVDDKIKELKKAYDNESAPNN